MKRKFSLLAIIYLSVVSITASDNLTGTYELQILQALRFTRPEMISQIQEKFSNSYSNAPVMQQMINSYIQEQFPADLAKVYSLSAQKYVSGNDLQVLTQIFNEPQYRKCIDSVAVLKERAWDIVPEDNPYWDQRKWVTSNIVLSLTNNLLSNPQQFDSLAQSLMAVVESKGWWTEEWMTKFIQLQIINGNMAIASKTLTSLMRYSPSFIPYVSAIGNEKQEDLLLTYFMLYFLSEAPEWSLVASDSDLDYYISICQRDEYQQWCNAQSDFYERWLNMDASLWCELATDINNYLKAHFPDNTQEIQQQSSEMQIICGSTN